MADKGQPEACIISCINFCTTRAGFTSPEDTARIPSGNATPLKNIPTQNTLLTWLELRIAKGSELTESIVNITVNTATRKITTQAD